MTFKEALQAKAQCPVDESALEVALIDAGLNPSETYTSDNQAEIEKALVDLLFSIYTKPDISEGGFQIGHPDFMRKLRERIIQLATKYKMTEVLDQLIDPIPTVTGKSVW